MNEDMRRLREAWLILGYEIARATGMLRLVARLGMIERPWVEEARELKRLRDSA